MNVAGSLPSSSPDSTPAEAVAGKNPAAQLLERDSIERLRRFSPFDQMDEAALDFLAARAVLVFYPREQRILTPDMGTPRHVHFIQRGKVQMRQGDGLMQHATPDQGLSPGECFPLGAASARRPSTNEYIAAEDSFCYRIDTEDFHALMRKSPEFHLFCTQYLASLLSQSRQQLQSSFAQRATEQQTMTTPLAKLIKREAVHLPPDTPTREALERMHTERVPCMVITNEDQRPIGILTQGDILPRIVLDACDLSQPVANVMSPAPHALPASASAYDAALKMATHAIHHLLILDDEGKIQGVVSERDLFALQRIGLGQIRAGIDAADDIESLQRMSRDIRQLALNLIAQGIGAEQLTQFISALNDALTRRIIERCLRQHALRDIEFVWLAFGSEGRHEQTLSTDQDNGLLFLTPAQSAAEDLRSRLLPFARQVNEDLAACGFPLCKGNIMASNPALCLTMEEWKRRFRAWIDEPDPQALLNASIFFDFRVLWGPERHGHALRRWLNEAARKHSSFLRMMAATALDVPPPLGRLRDFVLEDDGSIDLKKSGARLFVDAARILGLRTGVDASSTVQRLRQAGTRMGVPAEEVNAILDGFHFIQLLRLRSQHLDTEHDAPGDNCINPEQLNELDRRILKEAFRQARKLQTRLKLDYQL